MTATRRCLIALCSGLLLAGTGSIAVAQELPAGELQIFAGNSRAANFIILGEDVRRGDTVEVSLFTVYAEGIRLSTGTVTQQVSRVAIDCTARTARDIHVHGFSASGRLIDSLPPRGTQPIETNDTHDFVARMFCDGVQIRPSPVTGHAAAVALTRERLGGNR